MHLTYGVLGQWIETHGYRITAPPREIFFDMQLQEQDLVVEIQIPVEARASASWLHTSR